MRGNVSESQRPPTEQRDQLDTLDVVADSLPPEIARPGRRFGLGHLVVLIVVCVLLAIAAIGVVRLTITPAPVAVATPTPTPRLTAHGEVQAIRSAHVGALTSGVITDVAVSPGDRVAARQEIARITGLGTTEVVDAPWAGIVTFVYVQAGDTVIAGSPIATVSDISQLEVETTDVDEFLVTHISVGQQVSLRIDALGSRTIAGHVRAVSPQPTVTISGDTEYPVVIDIDQPSGVRIGMTARIDFAPK